MNDDSQNAYRVLTWAIGVYIAIGIAVTGFTIKQAADLAQMVHGLDKRVTFIEASRFTVKEASELKDRLFVVENRVDLLEQDN